MCPGPPKKIWAAVPLFADETIAFPQLDDCADAKTSSNVVASNEVDVVVPIKKSCIRRANAESRLLQVTWGTDEVRTYEICDSKLGALVDEDSKRKSCLRRPDAEPRRSRVTWGVTEERLYHLVPSEDAATFSGAPEKKTNQLDVASSSASNSAPMPSNTVEYVNGLAENGTNALMALADRAVAGLEAMQVEIVMVRFAPPQPEFVVLPPRRPRRQPVYDAVAHAARLATLRPRPEAARRASLNALTLAHFGSLYC